jgi:hypothetical protein
VKPSFSPNPVTEYISINLEATADQSLGYAHNRNNMNPQFIIRLLFALQEFVGPVSGHLSINKQKVPLGEAIEIRVEAVNQGNRSIEITSGAPGTPCGNFQIKILQGRNIISEIPAPEKGPDIIGNCCLEGKILLLERALLNQSGSGVPMNSVTLANTKLM